MQPDQQNAQLQIVERIRQATNILVTVQNNPSVDALAAALSLTLMLNKMNKHATAVFSGAVPPAISFLEPNKTFENSVDSLRDFIIALDKEKADRLRYKVEDDVVKIFITPYQAIITEKDLKFSQGDFNVEVIVALGVEKREELDKAIVAHGRILHDATVITINTRNEKSSLGSLDWQDQNASSICEMLFHMSEAFQLPGLLDQQIATALLTGIVGATDRFSNQHTTPRVMTMAAQLMAAGANQQLIANNLASQLKTLTSAAPVPAPDGSQKIDKTGEQAAAVDGEMKVAHDTEEAQAIPPAIASSPPAPLPPAEPPADQAAAPTMGDEVASLKAAIQEEAKKPAEKPTEPPKEAPAEPAPAPEIPKVEPGGGRKRLPDIGDDHDTPISDMGGDDEPADAADRPSWAGRRLEPPSFGGTLSATASEAEEDKRRLEAEEHRNHTILTHREASSAPTLPPPAPAPALEPPAPEPVAAPAPPPAPAPELTPPAPPTPPAPAPPESTPAPAVEPLPPEPPKSEQDQNVIDLEDARRAVDEALASGPFDPAGHPAQDIGAQTLGEIQHDSTVPPQSVPPPSEPNPAPLPTANPELPAAPAVAPQNPAMPPPLPDFSTLPPLPPMPPLPPNDATQAVPPAPQPGQPGTDPTVLPPTPPPPAPPAPGQVTNDPNDPNQFKIPGQ